MINTMGMVNVCGIMVNNMKDNLVYKKASKLNLQPKGDAQFGKDYKLSEEGKTLDSVQETNAVNIRESMENTRLENNNILGNNAKEKLYHLLISNKYFETDGKIIGDYNDKIDSILKARV